jgi:hypothetical protein
VSNPVTIKVASASIDTIDCSTRIPFRFGIHTLTSAPYATVTVKITSSCGRQSVGAASELLVPKWFKKDPKLTPEEDSQQLLDSVQEAFSLVQQLDFLSCFDLWFELYEQHVASQARDSDDLLVRGFGIAMLERAIIDAYCRLTDQSFHQALLKGGLGFAPQKVHPQLSEWSLTGNFAETPEQTITLRHTVGLLDVLATRDLQQNENPNDGLPTTLQEDIAAYGLSWFKLKVAGPGPEYVQRLLDIAELVKGSDGENAQFTIDGNEQFSSMEELAQFLTTVSEHSLGSWLLDKLAFIEQPLSRANTFDAAANADIEAVKKFAPVIIDEADFGTWSFPDAVKLGYQGVSVKACKGVFRALLNYALCSQDANLFQSGEDLTNLPARALQQDLCLMATLGIKHVERNGHHYFRGLDHLDSVQIQQLLELHPDLYCSDEDLPRLSITKGQLNLASLNCSGFGCRLKP